MSQQYHSKTVQFRTDNQKVVFGNQRQLFDNYIKRNNFQLDTISVLDALEKYYSILLTGGVA
jgi:hypothetical protein